ncbi:MAG: NAD-dependent protein deacylase [Coriobacteriales bacterium]|jgi:NAD-dependent deacetylase|nr:NAD-dependent protein deacylase [Coriobacteriales bacterium]
MMNLEERIALLHSAVLAGSRVVFFGGAGVSTQSGIPDFRSRDGLYNQHYAYPPEDMLSRTFFYQHTEEFFEFYREKVVLPALAAKPNAAHQALVRLEDEGHLRAVITQNIDGLHQAAGSRKVLELHGSIQRNYCEQCGAFYDAEQVLALLAVNPSVATGGGGVPRCSRLGCTGLVKPDVVLYEEPLNSEVLDEAVREISEAEVLIVGGTSLVVNPAASLVGLFRGNTLVVINKSDTWSDASADILFHEDIATVLGGFLG